MSIEALLKVDAQFKQDVLTRDTEYLVSQYQIPICRLHQYRQIYSKHP